MDSSDMEKSQMLVQQFKIKNLIRFLINAKGNGTSMVSLYAPPREQIPKTQKMLEQEHGTAASIKSRLTKQSVQSAIISTKERLKLYNKIPKNGLCIFCGEILLENSRIPKKVTIDFEPYKPINTSIYRCENKFLVEPLEELLEDNDKFGFIIVDGSGCLYGLVQGNARETLYKFSVDLPKKHRKGGQSSVRFSRLREESRHNFVRKVCEHATQEFITNDLCNVTGIVLAGFADFKTVVSESDLFDQRLKAKIVDLVDVTYGMQTGFKEAIEKSASSLSNVRFLQQKKLINKFFKEIAMDTGMVVFGIQDTMAALEHSALQVLVLCQSLEIFRYVIQDPTNPDDSKIYYMTQKQAENPKYLKDPNSETQKEIVQVEKFTEWMCNHYKEFGVRIEFVTDKSPQGHQFFKGFSGVGGFLRYKFEKNYEEQAEGYAGYAVGGETKAAGAGGSAIAQASAQDEFDVDEDFI